MKTCTSMGRLPRFAVGGFGDAGGFLRLSHAIYNTDEEFARLRDAVAELARREGRVGR